MTLICRFLERRQGRLWGRGQGRHTLEEIKTQPEIKEPG